MIPELYETHGGSISTINLIWFDCWTLMSFPGITELWYYQWFLEIAAFSKEINQWGVLGFTRHYIPGFTENYWGILRKKYDVWTRGVKLRGLKNVWSGGPKITLINSTPFKPPSYKNYFLKNVCYHSPFIKSGNGKMYAWYVTSSPANIHLSDRVMDAVNIMKYANSMCRVFRNTTWSSTALALTCTLRAFRCIVPRDG